jgi:DNA-directed RNA polymerase subunit RPC12/RpoP
MSVMCNKARCDKCDEEFGVALEWKGPEEAIDEIKNAECPNCNSKEWHFTDAQW